MSFPRTLSFTLCFFFIAAQANAASLNVQISPQNPSEGEPFNYIATLKGVKAMPQIAAAPQCKGWEGINWSNPSIKQQIINGNYSLILSWQAKAKSKGRYPISPLVLLANGKQVKSNTLTLNITPVQTSDFYLFQSSLSSQKAYVGQSIDLNLDLLFSDKEIQKYERYLESGYELAQRHYDPMDLKGDWTKNFHIVPKVFRQAQGSNLYFGVKVDNVQLGDYIYRRHRLTFTLEAKSAGTFTIPPLQQLFYQLTFRRAFIGIDAVRTSKPVAAKSKALALEVMEPPMENRPKSFNGQVCKNLNVEMKVPDLLAGQQVQMHSPISLQLKVSGSIAPVSIRSPNWNQQVTLQEGFDISATSMVRDDQKDHTLFSEIVVRPKSSTITEIPGIEFSYFDPEKKLYKTIQTKPFPIKVQAVDESLGLEDQPLALLETKNEIQKSQTIGRIEGIEINQDKLMQATRKHWPWGWVMSLTYLPLLSISGFSALKKLIQHRKHLDHTQRFEASGTIKTLQSSQDSSAILDAVSRYINHKWRVLDPRNAKIQPESKDKLEQLLSDLEAASYAPAGGSQSSLQNQAIELIKLLEKEAV